MDFTRGRLRDACDRRRRAGRPRYRPATQARVARLGVDQDRSARGFGIAAFSRQAVQEELASGTLVEIPFGSWRVRRLFSLVRIRDAALTPAAQEFADTAHSLPRAGHLGRSYASAEALCRAGRIG